MSADDWQLCPFCSKDLQKQIENMKEKINEKYEILTAKEYDEFKKETEKEIKQLEKDAEELCSLRIDGVNDYGFDEKGDFNFHISAYCEHCGRE